jgi:hypothetical protein
LQACLQVWKYWQNSNKKNSAAESRIAEVLLKKHIGNQMKKDYINILFLADYELMHTVHSKHKMFLLRLLYLEQ